MFPIIAISILALGPAFAQDATPVLGNVATFSNLGSYLRTYTNGAVKPIKESYLSFKINHKLKEAYQYFRSLIRI